MDSTNLLYIKLQNVILRRILSSLDDLFDGNEDYEEIPMIIRYKQMEFCEGYFSPSQYSSLLLAVSLTGINLCMLHAREKLNVADYEKFAVGIQFDIHEGEVCGDDAPQYFIPSIIHTMRGVTGLIPPDRCTPCELSELDGVVDAPIGISDFSLYRLTVNSTDMAATRYYLIPRIFAI